MAVTIDELRVADNPGAWTTIGFALDGDTCVLGDVRLRLTGRESGRGLESWSLRGIESTELDGLSTEVSERALPDSSLAHPIGVTAVDHVVVISPLLERTIGAFESAGLDLRRVREEPTPAGAPRQAFFRLGPTIVEVIQEPDDVIEKNGGRDRSAIFWGLALIAPDIDATVASLGDRAGQVRDAVQTGRRIATLRRSAGLSLPVALMTPP